MNTFQLPNKQQQRCYGTDKSLTLLRIYRSKPLRLVSKAGVLLMITKNKKDRIIETALRVFAEKGFQDATITEISQKSGVSESTIYDYFRTKEELLFSIPEKISNDRRNEERKIMSYIPEAENRIRYFIENFIRDYQVNPDYSALVLLQLMPNKKFRQTSSHTAIRAIAKDLLNCIRDGINDGSFKKDLDPYLIRSMIMGTIEHMFIQWHMNDRPQDNNLLDKAKQLTEIILSGIRQDREDENDLIIQVKLKNKQFINELSRLSLSGKQKRK